MFILSWGCEISYNKIKLTKHYDSVSLIYNLTIPLVNYLSITSFKNYLDLELAHQETHRLDQIHQAF